MAGQNYAMFGWSWIGQSDIWTSLNGELRLIALLQLEESEFFNAIRHYLWVSREDVNNG